MTNNGEHLITSAKMRSAAAHQRTEAVLDDSRRMREVDSVVALARAAAASDASLLRRLEQPHQRNRELDAQNRQLRHDIAAAYGQLRDARH